MITTYKDKKLKKFFEESDAKNIPKNLERRIKIRLEAIDSAEVINDLRIQSYDLHELEGNRQGTWSIRVSGNWRITFRFEEGKAYDVNLEDYH